MLYDHACRFRERAHAFQRGVGVGDVVERHLLALDLGGVGDGRRARAGGLVECRALVGVLPVPHGVALHEREVQDLGQRLGGLRLPCQIAGDETVVARGVREHLGGQMPAHVRGDAGGVFQGLDHDPVVGTVDHRQHVLVILGRRAQHRRSPDIDLFHDLRKACACVAAGAFEGVEVHHQKVDDADPGVPHGHAVVRAVRPSEQAAMDARVQGLQASVEHLREAGVGRDLHDRDPRVLQECRRAAGRKDLHARLMERAGKIDDAGLIRHADERSFHDNSLPCVGGRGSGRSASP